MLRTISLMLRLPFDVFIYSLEMLAKTVQGFQRFADKGIDIFVGEPPVGESQQSSGETLSCGDAGDQHATCDQQNKEEKEMSDQDLSGDQIKVVDYTLWFSKRDDEVFFESGKKVVNYSSSAGQLEGQIKSEFLQRARDGRITRPPDLKDYEDLGGQRWQIREGDERFIRFEFEVKSRRDKEPKDYDKQQVDVLRDIRDKI